MMKIQTRWLAVPLAALVLLVGCGGGGGHDNTTPGKPVTATELADKLTGSYAPESEPELFVSEQGTATMVGGHELTIRVFASDKDMKDWITFVKVTWPDPEYMKALVQGDNWIIETDTPDEAKGIARVTDGEVLTE